MSWCPGAAGPVSDVFAAHTCGHMLSGRKVLNWGESGSSVQRLQMPLEEVGVPLRPRPPAPAAPTAVVRGPNTETTAITFQGGSVRRAGVLIVRFTTSCPRRPGRDLVSFFLPGRKGKAHHETKPSSLNTLFWATAARRLVTLQWQPVRCVSGVDFGR